jgi:hypothetical protein
MEIVVEAYRDCGSWAYLDTIVGILGLTVGFAAVAAAFRPGASKVNALAFAAFGVGDLALMVGFGGYFMGLRQMMAALAAVDPAMRTTIETVGRHEAQMCIWIGGGFWLPATVLAGIAIFGVAAARSAQPPPG